MKWLKRKKEQRRKRLMDARQAESIGVLLDQVRHSDDFVRFRHEHDGASCWIFYFKTMVNQDVLHRDVLPYIYHESFKSLDDLKANIPVESVMITSDVHKIQSKLMEGYVIVQMNQKDKKCALIPVQAHKNRQVAMPEVEFSVVGPKEAFIESINTNINLVRKRLPLPQFRVKELTIGKLSKTRVAVLYIDGIANQENVNTALQRLVDLEYDHILDSSYIRQIIADNSRSPFPQMIDTERPDRVAALLAEGKLAIIIDGSPHALTIPTTLIEFFSSIDDYFTNWTIASTIRMIRLVGITFSIFSTPLYVAILTYHYQLIPVDLLPTLITSRRDIPFPPILEVLFLELIIELLREAGARLPTKVGQTIGIVGGIVIGTASVEAGLTSNVLLIIVALAALASFTTPVYQMGNTIRLIRFPFLLFAQLWGLLGVGLCFGFYLAHLLRLTSLGRPYLGPIYPPRLLDLKDTLFRLPMNKQSTRPIQLRPEDTMRFNIRRTNEKRDIDE